MLLDNTYAEIQNVTYNQSHLYKWLPKESRTPNLERKI